MVVLSTSSASITNWLRHFSPWLISLISICLNFLTCQMATIIVAPTSHGCARIKWDHPQVRHTARVSTQKQWLPSWISVTLSLSLGLEGQLFSSDRRSGVCSPPAVGSHASHSSEKAGPQKGNYSWHRECWGQRSDLGTSVLVVAGPEAWLHFCLPRWLLNQPFWGPVSQEPPLWPKLLWAAKYNQKVLIRAY